MAALMGSIGRQEQPEMRFEMKVLSEQQKTHIKSKEEVCHFLRPDPIEYKD